MLNFKMSELIKSDEAIKYNINNMPDINSLDCLLDLIFYILQPIREHYKVPVDISSGYRSLLLNKKLQELGYTASTTSQHCKGQAVDFTVRGKSVAEVFEWCKNNLEYDQLIKWIHISFVKGKNRRQAFKV